MGQGHRFPGGPLWRVLSLAQPRPQHFLLSPCFVLQDSSSFPEIALCLLLREALALRALQPKLTRTVNEGDGVPSSQG